MLYFLAFCVRSFIPSRVVLYLNSISLFIYLSAWLPSCRPFRLSVCPSVCLSVCMSVCLSLCLYVCLSLCLYVCLSVCIYVCLAVSLSVCTSACLSVCMYVSMSVCLSVCLSNLIKYIATDTQKKGILIFFSFQSVISQWLSSTTLAS